MRPQAGYGLKTALPMVVVVEKLSLGDFEGHHESHSRIGPHFPFFLSRNVALLSAFALILVFGLCFRFCFCSWLWFLLLVFAFGLCFFFRRFRDRSDE